MAETFPNSMKAVNNQIQSLNESQHRKHEDYTRAHHIQIVIKRKRQPKKRIYIPYEEQR